MPDRPVTKFVVPVVAGCSPLLEMQHMPGEIFICQIQVRFLNNRSQINRGTVCGVFFFFFFTLHQRVQ